MKWHGKVKGCPIFKAFKVIGHFFLLLLKKKAKLAKYLEHLRCFINPQEFLQHIFSVSYCPLQTKTLTFFLLC